MSAEMPLWLVVGTEAKVAVVCGGVVGGVGIREFGVILMGD